MHLCGARGGPTMFKGKFRVTAGAMGEGGRVRNLGLERGKEVSLMLGGQEEGGDKVWFMG